MKEKILKRILIILSVFSLSLGLIFGAFPTKQTKGAVFPLIELGTSALASVVAAYFATSGIQLAGTDQDTDGSFLGNYVANWVKNSSSFPNNGYFDSSGSFIGSEDDLSVVQNNDNSTVSLIFGKEFAIWLEALKQLFVSENNLTTESTTNLTSISSISSSIGEIPYYKLSDVQASPSAISSIIPLTPETTTEFTLGKTNQYGVRVTVGAVSNSNKRATIYIYTKNPSTGAWSQSDSRTASYNTDSGVYYHAPTLFLYVRNNSLNDVRIGLIRDSLEVLEVASNYVISLTNTDASTIGLTGELTEGYEDFEEAINQDLTDANEEEVVVVDVGAFPNTWNPSEILGDILNRIIAGTLNPTYEGTRENMEEAEEEKEGEKPFVPELPAGWIKVDGLQTFFPFCIPFDLYKIIELLNVPAEAPHFQWKMSFSGRVPDYMIDIDLSPYNTVALVFRTMIIIIFLIFLTMKTRDLIRG